MKLKTAIKQFLNNLIPIKLRMNVSMLTNVLIFQFVSILLAVIIVNVIMGSIK